MLFILPLVTSGRIYNTAKYTHLIFNGVRNMELGSFNGGNDSELSSIGLVEIS